MGEGPEADARAARLEACGARVHRALPPIDEGELAGAFLVTSVVRDEQIARELRALADRHRFLLHVTDRPELSDLALPAVVWRGGLTVAIATGGASPGLARRLREDLEVVVDERATELVRRLAELRETSARLPSDERARVLSDAVAGVRIEGSLKLPE